MTESTPELSAQQANNDSNSWITELASLLRLTDRDTDPRKRMTLSCHVDGSKTSLYLPPEMSVLQPDSLRYLHVFAQRHNCCLVEDRRSVDIQPILEQRHKKMPPIAMGISLLLKQMGLSGPPKGLSEPHRLNTDSPHIGITSLIQMAATAAPQSKRVVLLPNQLMIDALENDTHPIVGHACNLVAGDLNTKLSCFKSPAFRAIGYVANTQFVIHVFLAGGPLSAPERWSHLSLLTGDSFRFQLFRSVQPGRDFGLFHNTYYIDLQSENTQLDEQLCSNSV